MIALGRSVLLVFAGSLLLCAQVGAQEPAPWPTKPIRFVVPQATGSTPDIICRLIADRLSERLGQNVWVENRPGAAGVLAAQTVARAEPDGYTALFATSAVLAINPYTLKALPYDPAKDFQPISLIARSPLVLFAHSDVPANTLKELIALDAKKRGALSVVTDGQRNLSYMSMQWLNKLAGTNFQLVPYTAIQQGVQDVVAGRVQLILTGFAPVKGFVEAGTLKPIAATPAERMKGFENIPSFAEDVPGYDIVGWFAVVAPKGVPAQAVSTLDEEIQKILASPEIRERMVATGFYPFQETHPEQASGYIGDEQRKWLKLTATIGIEPE